MPENIIANPHHIPLEVLGVDEFDVLLRTVGNHEAKAAVAALMMSQTDVAFTPLDLRYAISESQGSEPGWIPNSPALSSYTRSFVHSGVATENEGSYQAGMLRLAQKMAFCGAVLGSSLDFPETSAQKVFGFSSSGKNSGSPNLKYGIFEAVVTNDGHELSVSDVAYLIKTKNPAIDEAVVKHAVRALTQQGLLETHKLDATNNIKMQIVDSHYYERGVPSRGHNPMTRLMYAALGRLCAQNKDIIDFTDLREQVLKIDAAADQVMLRRQWNKATSDKTRSYPGLRRVERTIKDTHKMSTVNLHADHAEAVRAMLRQFDDLKSDPGSVLLNRERALSIINNPPAMATIFTKAQRFSANAIQQKQGDSGKTSERILAIVQESGTVDINDVMTALKRAGQPLVSTSVRNHLERLARRGALTKEERPRDPSSTRMVRFYTAE